MASYYFYMQGAINLPPLAKPRLQAKIFTYSTAQWAPCFKDFGATLSNYMSRDAAVCLVYTHFVVVENEKRAVFSVCKLRLNSYSVRFFGYLQIARASLNDAAEQSPVLRTLAYQQRGATSVNS